MTSTKFSYAHVLFLTCLALGTSTSHTLRHEQNKHTNRDAEGDGRGFRPYLERKDYINWRWLDHSVFKFKYYDFIHDMIGRVSSNTRKEARNVKLLSDSDQPSPRLYFFGDSPFDAGNTQYISEMEGYAVNYYPYGFTYFTHATGRACDGRTVPDFIAEFANMPFILPSLKSGADFSYGANFACPLSTVLTSSTSSTSNSAKLELTLTGQVGQFKVIAKKLNESLGSTQARDILSKAICIFNIGGVDYGSFYSEYYEDGTDPTISEQEQEVNIIVGNITENILELYKEGVRKFAFQGLGPLGCYPVVQSSTPQVNGSCAEALLSLAMLHNKALYEALEGLAGSLDGFNFTFMDYYTFLLDRIENPSDYGFEVPRTACYSSDGVRQRGPRLGSTLCEYPSSYLFFDSSHMTQHANEQAVLQFWNGSPNVSPYSLKELFYY